MRNWSRSGAESEGEYVLALPVKKACYISDFPCLVSPESASWRLALQVGRLDVAAHH